MASNGTELKESEESVVKQPQIGMVVRKRSSNFVWLFLSFLAVRPEVGLAARPEAVAWDSLKARHYLNWSRSNY